MIKLVRETPSKVGGATTAEVPESEVHNYISGGWKLAAGFKNESAENGEDKPAKKGLKKNQIYGFHTLN